MNKLKESIYNSLIIFTTRISGDGKDGLACVRFGMVVSETDVVALTNLVRQSGLDIEASTQELETMALLVRKGKRQQTFLASMQLRSSRIVVIVFFSFVFWVCLGIEEAQAELTRETEQKLWEEFKPKQLLRHIPVVGSLVNYFLPTQKTGIKGRTLNLKNGRIEKSETLVKSPLPPQEPTDNPDDNPITGVAL